MHREPVWGYDFQKIDFLFLRYILLYNHASCSTSSPLAPSEGTLVLQACITSNSCAALAILSVLIYQSLIKGLIELTRVTICSSNVSVGTIKSKVDAKNLVGRLEILEVSEFTLLSNIESVHRYSNLTSFSCCLLCEFGQQFATFLTKAKWLNSLNVSSIILKSVHMWNPLPQDWRTTC